MSASDETRNEGHLDEDLTYYCHQCNRDVTGVGTDMLCPRCNTGFLELIEHGDSDASPSIGSDDHPFSNITTGPGGGNSGMSGVLDIGQLLQSLMPPPPSSSGQREGAQARVGNSQNSGEPLLQTFLRQLMESLTDGGGAVQFQFSYNTDANSGGSGSSSEAPQGASGGGLPFFFNLHGNPGDYAWGSSFDAIVTQLLNQVEGGAPPLSTAQISSLPKVAISEEDVKKKLQCTVCFEDFVLDESVNVLACKHRFHADCIIPWLSRHNTCPVCRESAIETSNTGNSSGGGIPGNGPSNADTSATNSGTGNSSSQSSNQSPGTNPTGPSATNRLDLMDDDFD